MRIEFGLGYGDAVRVAMTKWGDLPHWEFDASYLGRDAQGDWIGLPVGTPMARPGAAFVTETDQVGLIPAPEVGGDGWWVATFHDIGYHVSTYVDMTSRPVWSPGRVDAIDLDLDVIRLADGTVYVDDEDEFAEHQVSYGYPADIVAGAEASSAWVYDAVLNERPPFDDSHLAWLARVPGLRRSG